MKYLKTFLFTIWTIAIYELTKYVVNIVIVELEANDDIDTKQS